MKELFLILRSFVLVVALFVGTITLCIVITTYAPIWFEILFFGICFIIGLGFLTLHVYFMSKNKNNEKAKS